MTYHESHYYVSQTGNDNSGTGTQDRPWKTVHKALVSVPLDHDDATIVIRKGTYKISETLLIDAGRGGSDGRRFTIAASQNEEVVIDGSLMSEQFSAMVKFSSASHVTLQGLVFENLRGSKSGIIVDGTSHHITITNNVLRKMTWVESSDQDKLNPSPVDNLNPIAVVGNHPTQAIKNINICANELYDIVPGYSEGIKIVGNVTNFVVADNRIHDIANIGIVAAGHYGWVTDASGTRIPDEVNQARNGVISNNTVKNAVSPIANSAGIYLDGARNVIVRENTSQNNSVGFSIGCEQPGSATGNILTKNIACDNRDAGLVVGAIHQAALVQDAEISHNKFRNNYRKGGYGGEMTIQKADALQIHHNLFSSNSDVMIVVSQPATNLDLNDNQYYGVSKTPYAAVFDWGGISGTSYVGLHEYQGKTRLDSRSVYKKGKSNDGENSGIIASALGSMFRAVGKGS